MRVNRNVTSETMEFHAQQSHSGRRIYASRLRPRPRQGHVYHLRSRSRRARYSPFSRLPRDQIEDWIRATEEEDENFENSFREVPWIRTVEPRLLQERGGNRFRARNTNETGVISFAIDRPHFD